VCTRQVYLVGKCDRLSSASLGALPPAYLLTPLVFDVINRLFHVEFAG
jgi:hypothetical protein